MGCFQPTMPLGCETRVHPRWFIRRDLADVVRIEAQSFDNPWTEDDFCRCLRQRNCIGMVAELGEQIVGYLIYEVCKGRLELLNFAVDPAHRRRGFGRQMVEHLFKKLGGSGHTRRRRLALEVRETNVAAQLFFRACGFEAVRVLRGHYEDNGEDAYRMVRRLALAEPCEPVVLIAEE